MESEKQKVSFFSRIKIAVAKLENYNLFLEEKTSVAVKYFFLIVLILVAVMAIVETYSIMNVVKKGYQYLRDEMPDFSYENETLSFSETVNAYDEEFDIYMIVDTNENIAEEKMLEYKETIKSTGVIFLRDKAIYQTGNNQVEYKYSDFASQYGIDTLNKEKLIQEIDSIGMTGIAITIFAVILVSLYIVQLLSVFMDWLVITIFAMISARICRINLPFKPAFNISIYALTLSIILSAFYHVAYYLTDFYMEYFRVVYLLISYVYVVAVILMIKSDLLKQQVEIAKVVEIQKEIQEENNSEEEEEEKKENKKPEEKDKKEEKNSQDNEVKGEPDGSEI